MLATWRCTGPAQHEPLGDLRIAQPLGDQTEDLSFPVAQRVDPVCLRRLRYGSRKREKRRDRCQHIIGGAVPGKVRIAVEHDEPSAADERCELTSGGDRDCTVARTVNDQRWHLDLGERVSHVVLVRELEQIGRSASL